MWPVSHWAQPTYHYTVHDEAKSHNQFLWQVMQFYKEKSCNLSKVRFRTEDHRLGSRVILAQLHLVVGICDVMPSEWMGGFDWWLDVLPQAWLSPPTWQLVLWPCGCGLLGSLFAHSTDWIDLHEVRRGSHHSQLMLMVTATNL